LKAETENDKGLLSYWYIFTPFKTRSSFSEMQLYKNISESAMGVLSYRSVYAFAQTDESEVSHECTINKLTVAEAATSTANAQQYEAANVALRAQLTTAKERDTALLK
jgi:hypothetical protein